MDARDVVGGVADQSAYQFESGQLVKFGQGGLTQQIKHVVLGEYLQESLHLDLSIGFQHGNHKFHQVLHLASPGLVVQTALFDLS